MAQIADKALIVNADDFGWSTGVNRGIVESHRSGILTSTTAMVTFPAFAEAAELARTVPALGVGLHLNVVHGPPVSDPSTVPSLLGRDGWFPGAGVMARRLLGGQIVASELDRELSAQLDRYRAVMGEPTHVDSHKHMHAFGSFVPAVIRLALKLRSPRARCPRERVPLPALCSPTGRKAAVLTLFAGRLRRALREAGVAFPEHFTGTVLSHDLTPATLGRLLGRLGPGTTELMCHPGLPSPDDHAVVAGVACTPYRPLQAAALQDASVRRRLEDSGARLCHYGQLPPPQTRRNRP